jgi:hypothetical protein
VGNAFHENTIKKLAGFLFSCRETTQPSVILHFDVLLVKKDIIALAREQGLGLRNVVIYKTKMSHFGR